MGAERGKAPPPPPEPDTRPRASPRRWLPLSVVSSIVVVVERRGDIYGCRWSRRLATDCLNEPLFEHPQRPDALRPEEGLRLLEG